MRSSQFRDVSLIFSVLLFTIAVSAQDVSGVSGAQGHTLNRLGRPSKQLAQAGQTQKAEVADSSFGYRYNDFYNFCSVNQNGNCADGEQPHPGLIQDAQGNLYGTTDGGGANSRGVVFKLDTTGHEAVLYSFCSLLNCADGAGPQAGLILDAAGNLYGTTSGGGGYGYGVIFNLDLMGQETVLYSFCSLLNCRDGAGPSGLIRDAAGNLYGTTSSGGAGTHLDTGTFIPGGTVFKLDSGGNYSVLYNFCAQSNCTDGQSPFGGVILDAAGNLYGTTYGGGSGPLASPSAGGPGGTVFKLDPTTGIETVLHSFCSGGGECKDGTGPMAGLFQDAAGNLYGTTENGGANTTLGDFAGGTVFKLDSEGNYSVLYSFCSLVNCTDGEGSVAGLILDAAGNLYGTTSGGGSGPSASPSAGGLGGTVFKLDPATGIETVLYSFCSGGGLCTDGATPIAGLIQDGAGDLYGTTYYGGAHDFGMVFKLTPPLLFVPMTPCRVVDTRNPTGPFGGPSITGDTSRSFAIPSSTCAVPPTATAYSLNVTVIPRAGLGYLTVWPTGVAQPLVSTLNSDGRVKANAAIVPAGTGGAISVYATDTTNVVLDINGYFVPATSTSALAFYSLTPCRVADTRNPTGTLGGPSLVGAQPRAFPILSSACNIPSSAQAYSLNFTAIPQAGLGYLSAWPTGQTWPGVSTLNAPPNNPVVANAAIVPAGTSGEINVLGSNNTDVVIDINGYFAPASSAPGGQALYTVTPCRVLDTRSSSGVFNGTLPVNVTSSPCAIPSIAEALVLNATVVPTLGLGYLTLWPENEAQPVVSTLNADDGVTASNMAIVPMTNGSIDAFSSSSTQLILDISGYFAPSTE